MKNILIIAVHPDDETLGCGGTILKHKANGDKVSWLILTKAHQKITDIPDIVEIQLKYVEKVAKAYNFDGWKQLSFLATELEQYPLGKIISSISNYIREIVPTTIYFHHFADVHSDHKIAFDAIQSCTKNFRYPFIEKILLFETLSETEFAPAIRNNAFVPNVFNDITPYLEKKLEIMKLFTTEQMEEPFPRALSTIRALARYRGSRIGAEYAEAFTLIFEKL
ncbi:MAG: PIG-L deacetylase family protein [Bacteroidales bacterium]|jgi:LmbE family N-acetylglucosaminyl deacetylase|nr:PIG-L deacetylase family protein [Bacteroidales bacterium]